MPFDRDLWGDQFDEEAIPAWPCPHCEHGHVRPDKQSLRVEEPAYSRQCHSEPWWEPEMAVLRFSLLMQCLSHDCGEALFVIGSAKYREGGYDDDGPTYARSLWPHAVYPAPRIIDVPEETPEEVHREIRLAFQLFWTDPGACANRLRTSIERMLDDLQVARNGIDKRRKRIRLSLFLRIERLKQRKKFASHGDLLDAMRHVGNVGTHEDVDRRSVLAAFEIYEHLLAEIYGRRTTQLVAMTRKIIRGKGRLRSSR